MAIIEKEPDNFTPEETWKKISTPRRQADIVRGTAMIAISLGLSPQKAGEIFANLDNSTANDIAYLFSGVGDGKIIKITGRRLLRK